MHMQGYDLEAAVPFICAGMRREGVRTDAGELEAFVRRAIQADMDYMYRAGVLDEEGLMGEGEYDDDDAFEALLPVLCGETEDEAYIDIMAQWLSAYMIAQQDFMEHSGLMETY